MGTPTILDVEVQVGHHLPDQRQLLVVLLTEIRALGAAICSSLATTVSMPAKCVGCRSKDPRVGRYGPHLYLNDYIYKALYLFIPNLIRFFLRLLAVFHFFHIHVLNRTLV